MQNSARTTEDIEANIENVRNNYLKLYVSHSYKVVKQARLELAHSAVLEYTSNCKYTNIRK